MVKQIISHGRNLYELLGKENKLNKKMDFSMENLEKVLKDYNQSSLGIEGHIKKLVAD